MFGGMGPVGNNNYCPCRKRYRTGLAHSFFAFYHMRTQKKRQSLNQEKYLPEPNCDGSLNSDFQPPALSEINV
jgi:hypothetical protein